MTTITLTGDAAEALRRVLESMDLLSWKKEIRDDCKLLARLVVALPPLPDPDDLLCDDILAEVLGKS